MTPTDFLIRMCEQMDDIDQVVIIRRYKDGCVDYGHSGESRIDMYAMVMAAKVFIEAGITVTEIRE